MRAATCSPEFIELPGRVYEARCSCGVEWCGTRFQVVRDVAIHMFGPERSVPYGLLVGPPGSAAKMWVALNDWLRLGLSPSLDDLASSIGRTTRSAHTALGVLRDGGWVSVVNRPGRASIYELHPHG